MKRNCWEFTKCGRYAGGEHAPEHGICPAATEVKLDSIHDGKNGGRACWVVAGTLCKGKVQGSLAVKYQSCLECNFYSLVKEEEGINFKLSPFLLKRLRDLN